MIESNRQTLTPCWLELFEEANKDGSIHTEYAKELSSIIPSADMYLIENTGHEVNVAAPNELATVMSLFYKEKHLC